MTNNDGAATANVPVPGTQVGVVPRHAVTRDERSMLVLQLIVAFVSMAAAGALALLR